MQRQRKKSCNNKNFSINISLQTLSICPAAYRPEHIGVSPSGKASAFGADIRWFESSHPSHRIQAVRNDGFFFIYQAFILVRMFKSQNRLFLSNIRTFFIANLCISIAYGILINFVSHLIYIIPPPDSILFFNLSPSMT